MAINTWLIYISVISFLIMSPGPSAFLCLSDGLRYGKAQSLPTVLGGAIAALLLMLVSTLGLAALLVASGDLFYLTQLAGAAYLIWLGWRTWHESGKMQLPTFTLEQGAGSKPAGLARFYRGFMVGVSNPKDILFFIALFPAFIEPGQAMFLQYAVLAGTWFVIDCGGMMVYAGLGAVIGPWISKETNMICLHRAVAAMFAVLGAALLVSVGA